MQVDGHGAMIKGNEIRRKGNKTSRSLPFLALPDVLFKKPPLPVILKLTFMLTFAGTTAL